MLRYAKLAEQRCLSSFCPRMGSEFMLRLLHDLSSIPGTRTYPL